MYFDTLNEKPHDLNELLNIIVERIADFTHAERTLIYLYDRDEKVLWNRAGQGADFMSIVFKLGQGIPGHVLEKEKTYNLEHATEDKRFDPELDEVTDVPVKSMLCVPITEGVNKKIGVIQLINKPEGEGFSSKDIAFVEAMAAQAAIAIANTSLFSKVEILRQRELELAEEIRAQNEELQEAYIKVESEAKQVQEAFKNVNKSRTIAFVGFIALVLVIGWVVWENVYQEKDPTDAFISEEFGSFDMSELPEGSGYYTVETENFEFPLTFSGSLQPAEIQNLFAPFTGRITKKNFVLDEKVSKGQELLRLSTENIESRHRTAQINAINAKEKYLEKKNWATGREMANAKREVLRAEDEYEVAKRLFKIGVQSKESVQRAEDALRLAKEQLTDVEEKGDANAVQIAEFEWKNMAFEEEEIRDKLDKAVIVSDVDGVAIEPEAMSGGVDEQVGKGFIEEGVEIKEGTVIVSVADVSRLKVLGQVEESAIASIKEGQPVQITGDAFPGIVLKGEVTYVSSKAKNTGIKTYFEIQVVTNPLTPEEASKIRLGMSATLSVVTYSNPQAILVPFDVIKVEMDGSSYVYKVNKETNRPEKVLVETGLTTPTSVEITSGLEKGDELIFTQDLTASIN